MKIRDEDLVPAWAASPEAFSMEKQHVQEKYREAVEAERAKTKPADRAESGAESGDEPAPPRRRGK